MRQSCRGSRRCRCIRRDRELGVAENSHTVSVVETGELLQERLYVSGALIFVESGLSLCRDGDGNQINLCRLPILLGEGEGINLVAHHEAVEKPLVLLKEIEIAGGVQIALLTVVEADLRGIGLIADQQRGGMIGHTVVAGDFTA